MKMHPLVQMEHMNLSRKSASFRGFPPPDPESSTGQPFYRNNITTKLMKKKRPILPPQIFLVWGGEGWGWKFSLPNLFLALSP
jgi:hypothetical protein